jgi:hypothetical protein
VHHQLTFSALSAGRVHALDNFGEQWSSVSANVTEAERVQAHADWEQFSTSRASSLAHSPWLIV